MKRRFLSAPDLVILAYQAIVIVLIMASWNRQDRPLVCASLAFALMAVTVGMALLATRRPGKLMTFLHSWWPVAAVPISFKMVAWIAPGAQPFADHAWDHRLQRIDDLIFGDTRGFFRSIASAPVADLMMIGYWSYYPLSLVLGAALYRPPGLKKFREATTVLLVGWFASYLGYYAIPALGPHRVVDALRAPELQGVFLAGPMHQALLAVEGTIPDAFPSGHALIALLALTLAWRLKRRLFWWLLPFASTLILATMYLRYHYVVDVLAAVALAPVSCVAGIWLARRREPAGIEPATPVWENPGLS